MRDLIILAADPSVLAQRESMGWVGRIFESVANDPGAIATISAAFLGFSVGTLIAHYLSDLRESHRRNSEMRAVAAALRAELVHMDQECKGCLNLCNKFLSTDKDRFEGGFIFTMLTLPPRRIWTAYLNRLGELEGMTPDHLTIIHAGFDHYDRNLDIVREMWGPKGLTKGNMEDQVKILSEVHKLIPEVGGDLLRQSRQPLPWWRRVSSWRPGIDKSPATDGTTTNEPQ